MEPHYNEDLGTLKITLLYQVSHDIMVKQQRNIKRWHQQNYLLIRGFCYIRPLYNEVPLYFISLNQLLSIVLVENQKGVTSITSVDSFLIMPFWYSTKNFHKQRGEIESEPGLVLY